MRGWGFGVVGADLRAQLLVLLLQMSIVLRAEIVRSKYVLCGERNCLQQNVAGVGSLGGFLAREDADTRVFSTV